MRDFKMKWHKTFICDNNTLGVNKIWDDWFRYLIRIFLLKIIVGVFCR